jgi:RNase P subunit RPR2
MTSLRQKLIIAILEELNMNFCKQCMSRLFGDNLSDETTLKTEGEAVICDGCGLIETDSNGNCLTHVNHDFVDAVTTNASD